MKIVFICTGNTCRSPMAELLFKNMLADDVDANISSAGLAAGLQPISFNSLKALREVGIEADDYISRPVAIEEVHSADYVITMTSQQKQLLLSVIPTAKNIYTLGELCEGDEVSDPFGMQIESYRKTREVLTEMLKKLAKKLNLPLKEQKSE